MARARPVVAALVALVAIGSEEGNARAQPKPTGGGICDVDPSACPATKLLAPTDARMPDRSGIPAPTGFPPPTPRAVPAAAAEAEWQLARSMMDARLLGGASAALGAIAENALHPRARDALVGLTRVARELPEREGADLERFVGGVAPKSIATIAGNDPDAAEALAFLVGKNAYLSSRWDDAAATLATVTRDPRLAPRAQLLLGATAVRVRRSVPAVQAFRDALTRLDTAPPSADRTALRDEAILATARTYYAASVRLDENDAPTLDSSKLSAFVKYAETIDPASAVWPDVAHELAFAFHLAGDDLRAAGHARAISSVAFPTAHAASGRLVELAIAFSHCEYDDAERRAIAIVRTLGPVHTKLGAAVARARASNRDAAFVDLALAVRDGKSAVDPDVARYVGFALGDRAVARRLGYLARLDAESVSPALATLGPRARELVRAERERAANATGRLVAERLQAMQDELAEAVTTANRALVETTAAKRNQLAEPMARAAVSPRENERNTIRSARPFLYPFARTLPDDVRRYETHWFYAPRGTKCGR